jgi:murein DD-endopeptidase MepM/ murein hydrolase activator NlpD
LGSSFCALYFPFQENEEGQGNDASPCGFPLSSGLEHTVVGKVYHGGGEIKGRDYYPTSGKFDDIHILSTLDGLVTEVRKDCLDNTIVEISNGRYKVKFLHLIIKEELKVGDRVLPGDDIGIIGDEGNSEGKHLHYAIWSVLLGKNIENHNQFNHCIYGKMSSIRHLPK